MSFYRKAEMGVGTLIIFIALLLVAAVAAGVLIQTSTSLQEKALTTGDQAKGQIATNVRVVEVSATDGSTGYLNNFTQIVKLSPGSDAIKLEQTIFTFNTYDSTATLQYRGTSGVNELNSTDGFWTYLPINITGIANSTQNISLNGDWDEDGTDDVLFIENTVNVSIDWGSTTSVIGTCHGAGALANYSASYVADQYVKSVTPTGNICSAQGVLNVSSSDSAYELIVETTSEGTGYFTVEYLQTGTNHISGNLQRGDVVKLYYASPRPVDEDEHIRLNFVPKIGTPTLTEFITPEVISDQRIYLYP